MLCSDPFVRDSNLIDKDELIKKSDIIIIGAPHSEYKNLKLNYKTKTVVDIWNYFGRGGII